MFNNPEELAWYIHEHPDFAATAARATYSSALSAEKELGYEDGYLPEMLRILSNGLSCLKDLGIWPDCEDVKVYRGIVIFDIEPSNQHSSMVKSPVERPMKPALYLLKPTTIASV